MQKKETAIEVKVGGLVLLALSLLAGFVFLLGDFSLSDGLRFQVQFENAGGLKPGADVAIAGINVGSVMSLSFIENDNATMAESGLTAVAVEASLRVDSRYANAVRENSEFYITTRGVLGEPYIEIVTPKLDAPAVTAGSVLRGVDPPRMEIMLARLSDVLSKFTDALNDPSVQLNELIANSSSFFKTVDDVVSENRATISSTLQGADTGMAEAVKLLATMNSVVQDGEQIQNIVNDTERTISTAKNISLRVDGHIDPILADTRAITQSARNIGDSAEQLLVGNQDKIAQSIDNIHASTENLTSLSSDANQLVSRVSDGEGTVGALMMDREIYEDLKEIMRIIKRSPWKILWKE